MPSAESMNHLKKDNAEAVQIHFLHNKECSPHERSNGHTQNSDAAESFGEAVMMRIRMLAMGHT